MKPYIIVYWDVFPKAHVAQIGPMGLCVKGAQADTLPTLGPIGSVAYHSTHHII